MPLHNTESGYWIGHAAKVQHCRHLLNLGLLISGKQIVAFLCGLGIDQPIESSARPYAAVATDLSTGR